MKTIITGYCHVQSHTITCNGQQRYRHPKRVESAQEFLDGAYRKLGLSYPRFFKMDPLCKLAFLSAEILFKETPPTSRQGIVLGNRSSSLISDLSHEQSLALPSPAVFVYTLPNIMLGELCIRHQIRGENIVFLSDEFQAASMQQYTQTLFQQELCDGCLCGWVEASPTHYEAFLYQVQPAAATHRFPHQTSQILELYQAL